MDISFRFDYNSLDPNTLAYIPTKGYASLQSDVAMTSPPKHNIAKWQQKLHAIY